MTSEDHRLHPRKQPRQARAELTRARILTAAAHVFTEHGYAAGTTNRIAERARVSIGSLYQYFPNKDAILLELVVDHLEAGSGIHTQLQAAAAERASLDELVRLMVRAAIGNHQHDPRLLRLMISETPRHRDVLRRVEEHQRTRTAALHELLARHPEVTVADTDVAARMIVSSVELIVHQLVAAPVDPSRVEAELVAMLTRYLTGP